MRKPRRGKTGLEPAARRLLECRQAAQWALNSAVECHLHTVEVEGSNPSAPTIPLFRFSYLHDPAKQTMWSG